MLRKLVTLLILVPIAVLLVAFAVANRSAVPVSFDPFNDARPAFTLGVPLFTLPLAGVIAGVIIGGAAAWIRQGKWRRAARLAQMRARNLSAELDELKRSIGMAVPPKELAHHSGPRLIVPPPAA
jgi:uncharacterized integral membrane protein